MAHCAKTISSFFLIVLFLSLLQVEARESKFFSKVTPTTTTRTATTDNIIEPEAPQLAPAPEPILAPVTSTTAITADEILKEELGERYEEEEKEEEEKWSPYNNKNEFTNNNNNNNYYNTNGYSESYKNGNGYVSEKQGMSDTRFMENGKYYYNVKNENYYNGYESEKGIGNEGYYYNGNKENDSEGYYNGNKENEFESMEEYERQQGYPESQGEYVP